MFSTSRRLIGATIVLPAVLLAGACTKADTSGAPAGTQAQTTSAAPSSTAAGKVYSDKAAFIAAMKAATQDVKTAHMAMTMSGQGQEITMEGDTRLEASNPATQLEMSMAGMDLQVILVDKKVYVKGIPGQDTSTWGVLDEDSPMGKELASSAEQMDPARMYDDFEKALTDVKHLGEEQVDGETMAKYELTMDTASLPDMPTDEADLPETLTYLVWLDEQDRMRKMTFDLQGMSADITMSKYGEPVDITAPPADQTVELNL